MDQELERQAYIHALHNAVSHGGDAEIKPVMGKLMSLFRGIAPAAALEAASKAVQLVNSIAPTERVNELQRLAPELLVREKKEKQPKLRELEGAGEGFTVRLAPFPSGALHIGNVRMIVLNDEYAKKYRGRLLLVFDDTIGSEEKVPTAESYELIRDGLRWLGVKWDAEYYKSDRLHIFYSWAEKLIERNIAYVCLCPAETLREYREKGIECEHRHQSSEENMLLWRRMLEGSFREGEAVLRAKTDMKHSNPAFRDRVLCRISEREHPRVGRRYRVWPMLEFSWAVDDIELGMTHIIRGKDLVMEDMMERFIWDSLGIKGPRFEHFGLLRIAGVKISKSKSNREVATGVYSGWDDPRTWSLQSLRARGFKPEAIRNFMLSLGMSLADIEIPVESIYAENRRMIEPEALRYFFVPNPVHVKIEGLPEIGEVKSYLHPDRPELGVRKIRVSPDIFISSADFEKFKGSEVRLKDFCNVKLDENARFIDKENREIKRIQWVPAEEFVRCSIVMPDGEIVKGVAESNVRSAELNKPLQFERFGFVNPRAYGEEMLFYFTHE
jgi:glutamyl-tRNA synthetase